MIVQLKISRGAALKLVEFFHEVSNDGDYYSHTSVVTMAEANHITCGGNHYAVRGLKTHGHVTFRGSRSSIRDGSNAIEVRPNVPVGNKYAQSLTLKPGDFCRVNGLIGRVVRVTSSLPAYCPMADDAWADDRAIFNWLAEESAADQAESTFGPISAHVLANGGCAAAYI